MSPGATLDFSLYYRDAASNQVAVAATTITNNLTNFPDKTNFVAFRVDVPTVRAGDAWAGQNIGVQFLSTVTTNLQGGYWDLDNIRLTSQVEPVLRNSVQTNSQFSFTLLSEPGSRFDILTTTNLALATSNWTSVVTLTNDTGTMSFTNPVANPGPRFYRALQRP